MEDAGPAIVGRTPPPTRALPVEKQVLRWKDPESKVDVVIVGTMHYNPRSISVAAGAVGDKAKGSGGLSALVLETCPKRWKKTLELQPSGSMMRMVFDNEFQAAFDAAGGAEGGVEVVLGDQRIEDLGPAMKAMAVTTALDLLTPSGWGRLASDYKRCYKNDIVGLGPEVGITMADFGDPLLLAALPVALVRYPLAWVIKAPKAVVPVVALLAFIAAIPDLIPMGADIDGVYQPTSLELGVTFFFFLVNILEVTVLTRLFLVTLLEKRNTILADSIRAAAAAAAPGSAVVAVLGAAHLNGVQRLLLAPTDDVV